MASITLVLASYSYASTISNLIPSNNSGTTSCNHSQPPSNCTTSTDTSASLSAFVPSHLTKNRVFTKKCYSYSGEWQHTGRGPHIVWQRNSVIISYGEACSSVRSGILYSTDLIQHCTREGVTREHGTTWCQAILCHAPRCSKIIIIIIIIIYLPLLYNFNYRRIRTDQKQSKKIYLTIIKRDLINTIWIGKGIRSLQHCLVINSI